MYLYGLSSANLYLEHIKKLVSQYSAEAARVLLDTQEYFFMRNKQIYVYMLHRSLNICIYIYIELCVYVYILCISLHLLVLHISRSTFEGIWRCCPNSQRHFWRPPNEDPVKIQRQAAREEEARIAKVVEFGVTKTNLFFWG